MVNDISYTLCASALGHNHVDVTIHMVIGGGKRQRHRVNKGVSKRQRL